MTTDEMMQALKKAPTPREIESMIRRRHRYGRGRLGRVAAFVRALLPWLPDRPLRRAQDLADEGFSAEMDGEAIEFARRALNVCPDCADAYVLLAERSATGLDEKRAYFEAGVKAGERALGEEIFMSALGDFWALLETRPYMRAQRGLAEALIRMDEIDAATGHLEELLRLNPHDNQGNRFLLVDCYLAARRHKDLAALLEEYTGDAASSWSYTRALLLFRVEGESDAADRTLAEALQANPHVPDFLLGKKKIDLTKRC